MLKQAKRLAVRAGRATPTSDHRASRRGSGSRPPSPPVRTATSGDRPVVVHVRGDLKDAVDHTSFFEELSTVSILFEVLDLPIARCEVKNVTVDPRSGGVSSFSLFVELRTLRASTLTPVDSDSIRIIARLTGFDVRIVR